MYGKTPDSCRLELPGSYQNVDTGESVHIVQNKASITTQHIL